MTLVPAAVLPSSQPSALTSTLDLPSAPSLNLSTTEFLPLPKPPRHVHCPLSSRLTYLHCPCSAPFLCSNVQKARGVLWRGGGQWLEQMEERRSSCVCVCVCAACGLMGGSEPCSYPCSPVLGNCRSSFTEGIPGRASHGVGSLTGMDQAPSSWLLGLFLSHADQPCLPPMPLSPTLQHLCPTQAPGTLL